MKQLTLDEARQGREGKPVLIILLISLAAAAVVWILVEIFGSIIAPVRLQPAPPARQTVQPRVGRALVIPVS